MGLQTWPPSRPPLSSMACLDVETPSICGGKFKSVLQLCLQQRRTREQLVEQGIMPPLKTPATFHGQIRSLERARTGSFLKHKLCSRPDRSELVRRHILQETQAEPSLQATQMRLKRARLADGLNEKIAQRPGAMELLEKNILRSSPLTDDSSDCKSQACSRKDVHAPYGDAGDAVSPERPDSRGTPSSTSSSPRRSVRTEPDSTSAQATSATQLSPGPNSYFTSELVTLVPTSEQRGSAQSSAQATAVTTVPSTTAAMVLVKQSLHKPCGEKSRGKRGKEAKPRMKKLKYHQYIPPDQKQELSEVPMDSAYARLLQQQQQFLQLQILNQQHQQYNPLGVLPATVKTEVQTICSSGAAEDAASPPVQTCHTQMTCKLDHLPAHLDEMKVAELKMELKLRSLPVSGTKTDLIERLKLFQETSVHTAATGQITSVTAASQSEKLKLTPPVSPIASKVSSLGIEDSLVADCPAKSPAHTTPCSNAAQRFPTPGRSYEKDFEKDKRLHEKELQIEELIRKLEQEQRLVEKLKMQLEVEKRSQQGEFPPQLGSTILIQVKEENKSPTQNCLVSRSFGQTGSAVMVKQEDAADQIHSLPPSQCFINRAIEPPETLQSASSPTSAAAIPLPTSGIGLHTNVSGLMQTSGQVPQKTEASAVLQQQSSAHSSQPPTRTWRRESTKPSLLNTVPVSGHPVGASTSQANPKGPTSEEPLSVLAQQSSYLSQPHFVLQQPQLINHVSKCKDPPRYEDAVKQTHSRLTAVQAPTAASQQMDDLFDVLIESGEISPFMRQDPSSLDKPLPVTASVTTLPINTVLSRPPPVVQVAQLPVRPFNPSSSLSTLLDVTLGADTGAPSLKLMEELHSPLGTMEVDFNGSTQTPALTLHSSSMDNMDWLDLTLSVPGEGVSPLDMSAPVGVFSSDFLDSNELHLNWD